MRTPMRGPRRASARRSRRCRGRRRGCGRRRRSRSWCRRPRLDQTAPSASSSARSPLSRKPPVPSPKSASSGEQPRSRRGWTSTRQPIPAPIADSARAQARPPSVTSWAEASRPARTASRTVAQAAATAAMSGCGSPVVELAALLGQLRAGEGGGEGAEQGDRVARRDEGAAGDLGRVGQLADHADHRGRVDRPVGSLVVEGDVAADDRDAERGAGLGEGADRAVELPGGGRLLRVAEVEAVGQAERLGADAGEVLGALEHRLDRPRVGVAGDAAAVAVDRDRDRVAGLGQLQDRGVGRLRPAHRARADDRVVLLEGPALGGDAGGAAAAPAARPRRRRPASSVARLP